MLTRRRPFLDLSALPSALRSATLWIITAMAAVCVMVLALELWHELRERTVDIGVAEKATINLAKSLAQHADDTFEMADITLLGVTERLMIDGTSPGALARLGQFLRSSVAANSRMRGLFVYDASGHWVASSLPDTPGDLNNADRDYFKYLSGHDDGAAFIGQPVRSRSGGQWILTLARRFNRPDGSFGGVALATVDIDYFVRFYESFNVGRGGSLALTSSSGRVLARVPQNERFVGVDLAGTELFKNGIPALSSGSHRSKSPLDGIDRIIGYQGGAKYPIAVLSAVSEEEALADWKASAVSRVVVTGLMLIAIAVLGLLLLAYVRRHRSAEFALNTLSRTDALTGLCNRRAFDEKLAAEWSRCKRDGTPLSLLLFDLDRFKLFNDTYGHQAGDECLRSVAAAMRGQVRRPADMTARYGGEELAVLLPGTDKAGAVRVAEKIRLETARLGIPHAGNEPAGVVTLSGGVAFIAEVGSSSGLVDRADTALYEAKRSGRNRIVDSVSTALRLVG